MWRSLRRISLALVLFVSGEVLAVGLGDIKLDSALNEPLRAEIELLSATPEEIADLVINLASAETFDRYGIDRPVYLQQIQFDIVKSGGATGNFVRISSPSPITEPFLTVLVEATWSRGRLLREYTVLLDPPTYAPPAVQQAPVVQAPSRATPTDSGRIERQPEPRTQEPAVSRPSPAPAPARSYDEPKPMPVRDDTPYDTSAGGDYYVQKGETLWGLASRVRPDDRLTINQTMMAIFEANPQAFGGNINMLRAGASLRIPSADQIYSISRGEALSAVQNQHAAWGGYTPPAATEAETSPSLTLVPPDEEDLGRPYDADFEPEPEPEPEPLTREEEIEAEIASIEASDVPVQQSLIEIRNNQLAELRRELAEIRGEVYEPELDELDEDPFVDEPMDELDDVLADDAPFEQDEVVDDADEAALDEEPVAVSRPAPPPEKGFFGRVIDTITQYWMVIIGAVVAIVGAILFLFLRRGRDDVDDSGPWEQLDEGELEAGALASTESMRAPQRDEAIVVVEQDTVMRPPAEDTVEVPAPEMDEIEEPTGEFGSLEDTFSSETAVNLDQTDPLAEADFHMAYGLYDQAADLVNGALENEPGDKSLLAKLCEIYFVWGNRDAFIDAAGRLKDVVGGAESASWDKTVIMGQQIAADDPLFAGASAAGATKAVDLSFEDAGEEAGALDMDFGGDTEVAEPDESVDFMFGEEPEAAAADSSETVDAGLDFDLEPTAETPTIESSVEAEPTVEMPSPDKTVETPTIEQQFDGLGTAELPSIDEADLEAAIEESGQAGEETAEINLDDLGLDVEALDEVNLGDDLEDLGDVTGKNPEVDPDATGRNEVLDMEDPLASTGMRLAPDETGASPMLDPEVETDVGLESLLDATGRTQVLSDEMAVDTGIQEALSDDDATMLAGLDDDGTIDAAADDDATKVAPGFGVDDDADEEFDFAKTEALPADVFTGDKTLEETAEIPAVAETDVDLDLDDLTEALKISQAGDTVDMPRDDATVEQPRPVVPGPEEGKGEGASTVSLGPEDMSEDLNEARTMTEVGTKLDLARAYVDMGDPQGARSILEEVLDEGDESQRQQAQQLLDSLPS